MKLTDIYDDLAKLYGNQHGEMVFTFSDKGSMHSYIDFYESYMQKKIQDASLLEIGMMTGGSMLLWKKYFRQYRLVGLDVNPSWNQSRPFQAELENDPNITLLFGKNSLEPIPDEIKDQSFDFVIDDGDHRAMSQMETFRNYWPLVAPGGTYFIEDVIGPTQIDILTKFIEDHRRQNQWTYDVIHYQGFKNNRADDQILAVTRT